MNGKCSEFGGEFDETMLRDPGLALYEPWEADRCPDRFFPEDRSWMGKNPGWKLLYPEQNRQPTWARLRTDFLYVALRYDHSVPRKVLQNTPIKVLNPQNGDWAIAFLVDWGPAEDTNRLVDCSPGLLKRISASTDENLEIKTLNI